MSTSRTEFLYNVTVTEERVTVTEEVFLVTEEVFLVTEEVFLVVEERLFFLFIALRRIQNPIGGCCSRLRIPELARGLFRRLQRPWLARDILHPAQGVFLVFVFSDGHRGDTGPTQGKFFYPSFCETCLT